MWKIVLTLVLITGAAQAQTITGPARVIDGDTIVVGPTRVRLARIDAPELHQPCLDRNGVGYACGWSARTALESVIGDHSVTCQGTSQDLWGRTIAVCSAGSVPDLGAEMVKLGWAIDYRAYDKECTYCALEANAREASLGIWKSFETPANWRKTQRSD